MVLDVGCKDAAVYNLLVAFLLWNFVMYFKVDSYAYQGFIYLIKHAVKTVILWNIII